MINLSSYKYVPLAQWIPKTDCMVDKRPDKVQSTNISQAKCLNLKMYVQQ